MSIQKFFRGLATAIIGYLVFVSLVFAANASVFTFVTSDKDKVKQIIADSGVYDDVVPALIDQVQAKPEESKSPDEKNLLADKEVKALAIQAFDDQFVQTSSESFIDGVYAWLEGETETPQFSINIKEPRNEFINLASAQSYKKAQKLPACTYEQLIQIREIDVLDPPCLPPNLSQKVVKAELTKELSSQKNSFLTKNEITEKDLAGDDAKPFLGDFKNASGAFETARALPWFLVFIALVSSAILLFISERRSAGLRRVGIVFATTAVFIALTPLFIERTLSGIFNAGDQPAFATDILSPLLNSLNAAAASVYYVFGAVAAVVGIALILISIRFKNRLDKDVPQTQTK